MGIPFPDDDPEVQRFFKTVEEDMLPRLLGSSAFMGLVPNSIGDPKYWVELGAAIMYEKPILLLVVEGRSVPQKLQKVADEIVVIPDGPLNTLDGGPIADEIREALQRMGVLP